jgi:O-antigen/teichoic acid export membrane protein
MGLNSLIGTYKQKLTGANRELFIHSSFALVIRVFAAISSFIMNLVVARHLGTSGSGSFFLCFAVITVLATFVRMGGDNLLIKNVSIFGTENKWKTVKLIVAQVSKRAVVFSIVVTALLLVFNAQIAKNVFQKGYISGTLFWMNLSMPLLALYTLIAFAFQGLNKVLYSVFIQNIIVPIFFSILVIFFKCHDSVFAAQLYFGASLLTVILTVFLWFWVAPRGEQGEDAHLPDNLWKSSYAFWSLASVQMAIQWGGQFISGIFCQQKDLAQLAIAQRTSMLISFVLVAVNLVSAPKFASMYKQGKKENLKRYAINSTRLMVAFATPIVLFIVVFPKFIMSFFGAGFTGGSSMLLVLALGQYVNVLTGSVSYLLIMSGHEKDTRNTQFMIGVFSIILNLVMVKYYGAFGAAVAIAVSVAAQNLIYVGMAKRRLGFNTMAIWS